MTEELIQLFYRTSIKGIERNEYKDFAFLVFEYIKSWITVEKDCLTIKKLKCESITIDNEKFELLNINKIIIDNTFCDEIRIHNHSNKSIIINDVITDKIDIKQSKNCNIKVKDWYSNKSSERKLSIGNSQLDAVNIDNLYALKNDTPESLNIYDASEGYDGIDNRDSIISVKNLVIKNAKLSVLKIVSLDIEKVVLRLIETSNFGLIYCNAKSITFDFVNVIRRFEILGLRPINRFNKKNKFEVIYSDFSKNYTFYDCDLRYYTFDIINTKLTEAKLSATRLPVRFNLNNVDEYISDDKNIDDVYNYKLDGILQIKSLAEKISDNFVLNRLNSYEQEVNYKLIDWKSNPLQKTVLFFNLITTHFGRDWVTPMVIYLIVGLLLYSLIITINGVQTDVNQFGGFLNPTHRLDIFYKNNIDELGWGVGLIDMLARVIFAYLGVQTVTTFRKYTKL